ncbi:MAG: hypothetical protein M9937_18000 [Chelatococcus sp.]|nr:hypothetical protein [Chelatococcus sp.]MCO5077563.1 hypothetical protein [Chelatococcus sp.]CAH1668544.1 hypothetical protein CHELA41_23121 [Hyphomicrobiales bacterium]
MIEYINHQNWSREWIAFFAMQFLKQAPQKAVAGGAISATFENSMNAKKKGKMAHDEHLQFSASHIFIMPSTTFRHIHS